MTTTQPATQPATPGEALRKRLADAKRHLFAHIIASAHLLDAPFTNAPDQSPWSRMKHAMEGLDAAIAALDAAPTVYALPPEPPEDTVWSSHGTRWDRDTTRRGWWLSVRTGDRMSWHSLLAAAEWLSTTPPAGTEGDHAE